MCGYLKKCLVPSAFPIMGRLKHKVINSALQSRYCLVGRSSRTRQTARYHASELGYGWFVGGYLTDFSPSRYITQVHFTEGVMHKSRLISGWTKKKMLGSFGIPLLVCLRRQAINSALQSGYCLKRKPSGTRKNARYNLPE